MSKGIRAFSDSRYNYYKLLKDIGQLKAGAIFYHDKDDDVYGSMCHGCLKLCWTPDGNCYSMLGGGTVILHASFAEDKELFEKVEGDFVNREEIIALIQNVQKEHLDSYGILHDLVDKITNL